jgi:hypothetical protein
MFQILGFSLYRTPKTESPQSSTLGVQALQDPQRTEPQYVERTESQWLEVVHKISTSAMGLTWMEENPINQLSAPPLTAPVEDVVLGDPQNLKLIATQVVKEFNPSH